MASTSKCTQSSGVCVCEQARARMCREQRSEGNLGQTDRQETDRQCTGSTSMCGSQRIILDVGPALPHCLIQVSVFFFAECIRLAGQHQITSTHTVVPGFCMSSEIQTQVLILAWQAFSPTKPMDYLPSPPPHFLRQTFTKIRHSTNFSIEISGMWHHTQLLLK